MKLQVSTGRITVNTMRGRVVGTDVRDINDSVLHSDDIDNNDVRYRGVTKGEDAGKVLCINQFNKRDTF